MEEKSKTTIDVDEEHNSNQMDPPPYPGPPPEIQQPQQLPQHQPPVTHQPQMSIMVGAQMGQIGQIGQPGTMTVVGPGFIMLNQMVPQSTPFHCKSCNQDIITRVNRKPTFKTHFFAAGFCLVCCIPCAIIPYCMEPCRQADHYCPNCDSFIGSYIP